MGTYKKVMNKLAFFEKLVMATATLVILALIFVNVVGRFVFNYSFAFVDEFVVALFVLVSLIGAALACRTDGGLIGLSLISDGLKGKKRFVQKLAANVISIIYCAVLTYEGFLRSASDYKRGLHTFVMHLPQWTFSIFVPLGGLFLVLHFIENTVDFVAKNNQSEQEVK